MKGGKWKTIFFAEYLHFQTEKCFKKEARDFIALRTERKEVNADKMWETLFLQIRVHFCLTIHFTSQLWLIVSFNPCSILIVTLRNFF